jgi:P63C domain
MVYVQAEFRPWVRMFLDEFFGEIYRLHGWECRPGTSKRTPHVGKLIKHPSMSISRRGPGGAGAGPSQERWGHRPRKRHQHLTATTGNAHLDKQISTVTTFMRIAQNAWNSMSYSSAHSRHLSQSCP